MTKEAIAVADFRPAPVTTALDSVRAGHATTAAARPCEASPLPLDIELDIEEELHLRLPPKSVRVVQGKVTRRERAIFRSALLDQTWAE